MISGSPFTSLSTEELTWLQASILFDTPPTPLPKDDPVHSQFDRPSLCSVSPSEPDTSPSKIIPPTSPRPQDRRDLSSMYFSQHRSAHSQFTPLPSSSQWLHRIPRSSPYLRSSAPTTPTGTYNPSFLSRSLSNASVRTTQTQDSTSSLKSSSSFWSTILHPSRLRQENRAPMSTSLPSSSPLRTIPSQIQLVFTPSTEPNNPNPKPATRHTRSASLSSTLDSISLSYSPSSSRSESPITPVSLSAPFPYSAKASRRRSYDPPQSQRRYRRYPHSESDMTTPTTPVKMKATTTTTTTTMGTTAVPTSLTPPPITRSPICTKSILARTSSVSTRASSQTTSTNHTNSNKSVKFATLPTTVYYSKPYRDLDVYGATYWNLDPDHKSIDINVDSMDLDEDPFANYRSRVGDDEEDGEDDSEVEKTRKGGHEKKPSVISTFRSLTPTPERERERQKAKRIKRLLTFARRSSTSVLPNTAVRHQHLHRTASGTTTSVGNSGTRPTISTPYALGSYPHHPPHDMRPFHKLNAPSSTSLNAPERPWTKPVKGKIGSAGERHSASCESLQSSQATDAFSMKSVDSFGNMVGVGVGRFRDWLGKTVASGKGG